MSLDLIPFDDSVDLSRFDCGKKELNKFLRKHAKRNHDASISRVTLALAEDRKLVGFYATCTAVIKADQLPDNGQQFGKLPKYPLPAGLVAQLAADKASHGQGVGTALLMHAFARFVHMNDSGGIACFAVVVDAKDHDAETWYAKYGFTLIAKPGELYPRRMYVPLSHIKAALS